MFAMSKVLSTPLSSPAMHRNGRLDASRRSVICIGYRFQERHLPRRTRPTRVHCLPEPPGERVPTRRDPRQCHQRPSPTRGIHLHARKAHPPKRLGAEGRTRQEGGRAWPVCEPFLRASSVANSPGNLGSSSGPKAGGVVDAQVRRSYRRGRWWLRAIRPERRA